MTGQTSNQKWRARQSDGNNSTEALGASDTFTGEWELNDYPDVMVTCKADHTGILFFEFADIISGYDSPSSVSSTFPPKGFKVNSNIYEFHIAVKGFRWFRVRLVNDSEAQTSLSLNTYFGEFNQGNAPVNRVVSPDDDAKIVKSILSGVNKSDGSFTTIENYDSDRLFYSNILVEPLLTQLKLMNMHLSYMSGLDISDEDL